MMVDEMDHDEHWRAAMHTQQQMTAACESKIAALRKALEEIATFKHRCPEKAARKALEATK